MRIFLLFFGALPATPKRILPCQATFFYRTKLGIDPQKYSIPRRSYPRVFLDGLVLLIIKVMVKMAMMVAMRATMLVALEVIIIIKLVKLRNVVLFK